MGICKRVLCCGLTALAYANDSASVENLIFRMRSPFPQIFQGLEDISESGLVFFESIV
jgi:hypothetical protein